MAKQKKKQTRTMTPEAKAEKLKKYRETLEKNRADKVVLAAENQSNNPENKTIMDNENQDKQKEETTPIANDIIAEQRAFIEKQTKLNEVLLKSIEDLKNATPTQAPTQTIIQSGEVKANQKFGKSLRKELAPDDRLTLPETFVCLGGLFPMNVYRKNGTEVYAPLDKEIIFKPAFTEKKRMSDGKMKDCIYSLFSTSSKKEAQYVRESPHYGDYIFDNQTAATAINYELVTKIKMAADIVNKYNDMQLTQEASRYHIETEGVLADKIREDLKHIKLSEIIETESIETKKSLARLRVGEIANNGE